MNEIAASFIVVYFTEYMYVYKNPTKEGISERCLEMAKFFYDFRYAEADIYTVFNKIMELGHKEMFGHDGKSSKAKNKEINANSRKSSDLLIRIGKI